MSLIRAASLSQPDVQAAVNIALDGDVVLMPCGEATWTKQVKITKGITLVGGGATTIYDEVVGGTNALRSVIWAETVEGKSYRLANFTLRAGAIAKGLVGGAIAISGYSKSWRLDHVVFDHLAKDVRAVSVSGWTYGVIDHCDFRLNGGEQAILVQHGTWDGKSQGDGSWAAPSYLGTDKFVFVEDCTASAPDGVHGGFIDAIAGGRYVVRHNTLRNLTIASHGTESSGRMRSIRAYEVYRNALSHAGPPLHVAMDFRGGTGVIFENGADGYKNFCTLKNYRSWDNYGFWPAADGACGYDLNDGVVYETGTHTGPAGVTLIDATKAWTLQAWRDGGYSVHNVSQAWGSYVTSNTATTIALQPQSHGGQNLWQPGDTYEILRVQTCLDQIGRGGGNLLSGTPAQPVVWPQQADDPLYAWENELGGAPAVLSSFGKNPHIREGRDFYSDTVKPDYVPFIHPHPLAT